MEAVSREVSFSVRDGSSFSRSRVTFWRSEMRERIPSSEVRADTALAERSTSRVELLDRW